MAHRNIICTNPQFMDQGPVQIHPNTDFAYHSIYGTNPNPSPANQFNFVPTCQQLIGPTSFYVPSILPVPPSSCRFVPVQPVPVGPMLPVPVNNQAVLLEENESENGSDKNINLVPPFLHPVYVNPPYQPAQWGYINPMNSMVNGGVREMGNNHGYPPYYLHQMVPIHHRRHPHPLDQNQAAQMQVPPPPPAAAYHPPHHMMVPHGAILAPPSGVMRLGPRIPSFRVPLHPNTLHPSQGIRLVPSENAGFMEVSRINEMGNAIDEHIDMRLDIDGMTYEELLDLEERIGDVNTGLSEEIISNKLKTHFHIHDKKSSKDEPCIICQVEFEERERIGTLDCGHAYHSDCIKQWLELKNVCPICKKIALSTR